MSSLGSQWRVIRHYLSLSNLNTEVEKLVKKIKPATPEQWENLIKKFEKAVSVRLTQTPAIESAKTDGVLKATTVDETEAPVAPKSKEQGDVKPKEPASLGVGSEAKELTLESLWQGLRLKKDLQLGKISEPSWKSNKPSVTKSSIHSRTAYVISAMAGAETGESALRRAEHLIEHLHQYPEARDYAIKEGAVRALLRVQHRIRSDEPLAAEIHGVVNEALALVGYTRPPRGPGPNILSLDGGGIRGIIAIEILKHLERLTGRKVHELFDYIIGVSTGAIIGAVLAGGVGNLETASRMYHTLSREMFGNTSLIGGTSRLVWSHSYYDTAAWEAMLRDNLHDTSLTQCNRHNTPKLAIVSCVVNSGCRLSPYLFRSYEVGFRMRSVFPGTSRAKLWQAVRASAAAPTYFHEFRLDKLLHQDGGIMVNNPTAVGVHEAKLLYGPSDLRRGTVVSVGTGRTLAAQRDYSHITDDTPASTSWKDKFNKILDSATDTEGVHLVLNDLLPAGSYYRFNPPLVQDCAMDEIDPDKLNTLVQHTNDYIRRNQHKFEQAAAMLVRRRGVAQRVVDTITHRSLLLGASTVC